MPYTGKPSGACLTCRNRRIKCDEAKPFCLKCRGSNRQCLGYKDPSQVKFRDMTAMTIRRYKSSPEASESESGGSQSPEDDRRDRTSISSASSRGAPPSDQNSLESTRRRTRLKGSTTTGRGTLQTSLMSMAAAPAVSVNQHSISYLFTAYLGAANHYLDSGFSGVLETVVQRGRPQRYLSAAISATSIAAFSRRPNARSLTATAERVYSRALAEVNKALAKPGSIYDDDLLAAILILAMYELFMSDHFTGYFNHILGAAMIIRNRNDRPISSATAAMAFILVRNEIMKSSILTSLIRIEKDLDPWRDWLHALGLEKWTVDAYSHLSAPVMSGPVMHFKAMIYQVLQESSINSTQPLSSMKPQSPVAEAELSPVSDGKLPTVPHSSGRPLNDLLETLGDRYDRFVKVDHTMTHLYDFGPTPAQPTPDKMSRAMNGWVLFPDGPIYVYNNMLHAGYRLVLALSCLDPCSRAIAAVLSTPGSDLLRDTDEYKRLEEGGRCAITEIVGSAPYFSGLLSSSVTGSPCAPNSRWFDVAGIRDAQAISFSIWALSSAALSPLATAAQREYSLGMLRYCHEIKGLGQAGALHTACMEVLQKYTTPRQPSASRLTPSWMGRGTSLENLIYEAPMQNH